MDFIACPPDLGTKLRGGWSWDVFATGSIEGRDSEKLFQLIVDNDIPQGSEFHINSTGGSLIGGIELGRVIRSHNFITHVGVRGALKDGLQLTDAGVCMSAATLAFIGGEYRFISGSSRFGVHRFSLVDGIEESVVHAQRLSASIVEYIRAMDVDTGLHPVPKTPSLV